MPNAHTLTSGSAAYHLLVMHAIVRPIKPGDGIRVMSYNILAQSLIRREQYPFSGNSLKWAIRSPALLEEIGHYAPHLLCMQEVDSARVQWWKQELARKGMDMTFYAREGKAHGCMLAWNKSMFELVETKKILHDDADQKFQSITGNIAIAVKLKSNDGKELVLATTHLYWHPDANYERFRQVITLLQEIEKMDCERIVIGADTNSAPSSPAYQFLLNGQMSDEMHAKLVKSAGCVEFGAFNAPPEKRQPTMLKAETPEKAVEELVERADSVKSLASRLRSTYHTFYGSEPKFTNWTPHYRDTLDYVFVSSNFEIENVLEEVKGEMPEGLPFTQQDGKGYPSDHVPVVVDIKPL